MESRQWTTWLKASLWLVVSVLYFTAEVDAARVSAKINAAFKADNVASVSCPTTAAGCRALLVSKKIAIGGAGSGFEGAYSTKGCYSYNAGTYSGKGYFGTGGTEEQMRAAPTKANQYRPCGDKSDNQSSDELNVEPCRNQEELPEKYGYKWFPVTQAERLSGTSVSFTIDAERDAVVGISGSADGMKPSYEIIIGGNRNRWVTIDREANNPRSRVLRVDAPGVLRVGKKESFYINFDQGTISLGQGNVIHNRVIAKFKDPQPLFQQMNSVGISMFGHPGQWQVFCQLKMRCKDGEEWSETGGHPCKPCTKCAPGFPVIEECTPTSDTVCLSTCAEGKTWSETGLEPCTVCSACDGGQPPITNCTANSNSICPGPCESGRSWSPSGMMPCKWCGTCVPGSPIREACNVTQDVQCYPFGDTSGHMDLPRHRIPCHPGTWSSRGYEPCRKCTVCKETEAQVESCNTNHDVKCIPKDFENELKDAETKVNILYQSSGAPVLDQQQATLSP